MDNAEAVGTDEARWSALSDRDAAADGRFVFAVRTTGIYCRPSCPARRPRREHVTFFETAVAAEAAGYRACRRCHPAAQQTPWATLMTQLCRYIETADHLPSLAELAAVAEISPHHFHRQFKRHTGVTPRAYAVWVRGERLRRHLVSDQTVTGAAFAAGFGSISRFYAAPEAVLGMPAARYGAGAPDTRIVFATRSCWLGTLMVAATARGVCAILLGDDPAALVADLRRRFPRAVLTEGDSTFDTLMAEVVALAEAPERTTDLPLDVQGTLFQQRVWQALRQIPGGQTVSYATLAERIGSPGAVRAVAQACGANPVAIAVPCHRVVRSDGGLAGYRWGEERKRALLARERALSDDISE